MDTNKRVSERHMTLGLMSSVSDGKHSYLGVVEDISTTGIRMSQVPADFDDSVNHCYTVVKGPTRDMIILLRPCWAKESRRGMYKDVGFQIEDPPKVWKDFVDRLTNESDLIHTMMASPEVEM